MAWVRGSQAILLGMTTLPLRFTESSFHIQQMADAMGVKFKPVRDGEQLAKGRAQS
jgi:hypothetical protein